MFWGKNIHVYKTESLCCNLKLIQYCQSPKFQWMNEWMNEISVLAKSQQMFYYFFHLNEQQQQKKLDWKLTMEQNFTYCPKMWFIKWVPWWSRSRQTGCVELNQPLLADMCVFASSSLWALNYGLSPWPFFLPLLTALVISWSLGNSNTLYIFYLFI